MRSLLAHRLTFEWAEVHLVSDDPEKGPGLASSDELLWSRLKRVMEQTASQTRIGRSREAPLWDQSTFHRDRTGV